MKLCNNNDETMKSPTKTELKILKKVFQIRCQEGIGKRKLKISFLSYGFKLLFLSK